MTKVTITGTVPSIPDLDSLPVGQYFFADHPYGKGLLFLRTYKQIVLLSRAGSTWGLLSCRNFANIRPVNTVTITCE